MTESSNNLNQRIAERVRQLRLKHKLSLDALATKSGVSRSMISLVERGESCPTAVLLEKLASGLNVPLAALFDQPVQSAESISPVARLKEQPLWSDPSTGYLRRSVTPPNVSQPMLVTEIQFPPGQRVAFESGHRDATVFQQIWILEGTMEITVGAETYRLRAGDCLAMEHDGCTMFHNPTRKTARYAVVVATEALKKR